MANNVAEMRQALKVQQMRDELKSMQSSTIEASSPEVKDEMPEWLKGSDRAVVKNLANNKEESIKYLQGQYPNAEFTTDGDGEIIARNKGETSYGRLDPSFSPFSNPIGTFKDLGNDITDLGYDAAQVAAEAGGATLGTLAAPGIGTTVGMGTGAATASTAKEALRKHFGLSDEMDAGSVATDAGIAMALPKILQVAGKGISTGAKKVAPELYARATGLSKELLERIATQGDDIAQGGAVGANKRLQDLSSNVDDYVKTAKDRFAKEYSAIRGSGSDVHVGDVAKMLDDELVRVQNVAKANPGVNYDSQLRDIANMRDELFSSNASPLKMNVGDAMDLDNRISDTFIDWGSDVGQGMGTGNTVSAQQERLAKGLREKLRGNISSGSGGAKDAVDSQYKATLKEVDFLRKNFKDPKKAQQTLKALDSGKDVNLVAQYESLSPELKTAISNAKNDMELYRFFEPANKGILTEEGIKELAIGKTPLEKLLQAGGATVGGFMGGLPGAAAGGAGGRLAAKTVTNPKAVKAIAKKGMKVGEKLTDIEKAIQNNPGLMNLLYGTAYAGAVE